MDEYGQLAILTDLIDSRKCEITRPMLNTVIFFCWFSIFTTLTFCAFSMLVVVAFLARPSSGRTSLVALPAGTLRNTRASKPSFN